MEEIIFENEHLLIGNLGRGVVWLSFFSALAALVSYLVFNKNKSDLSWRTTARVVFGVHSIAVIGIFSILFAIIFNHYFEYAYAWQHASKELPVYYMISCFWEGQEGSFLLWTFWHAILGLIIIWRTPSKWETYVMPIICLAQLVLTSMILGVDVFDFKIGSSPFDLLRVAQPSILDIPFVQQVGTANYLHAIVDGTGLNPLLQNYWMVIHPPTLFLGFASSIVPFAFAIAALWKKDYMGWISSVIPWALFSVMILGTGIIMGGFWAYESLSFGGYWAWDPVENASLVPWLVIISATHVLLITKSTKTSLSMSFTLVIASFLLVLYATFLTRSGVLGDTSVHSFTDLGLSGQLLIFLFAFTALPVAMSFKKRNHQWVFFGLFIALLILNILFGFLRIVNISFAVLGLGIFLYNLSKNLPKTDHKENILSREFWMYIGSLVLLISSFQVMIFTSMPVFNKLFGTKIAPPVDVIAHYNGYQLPIAIVIALLTAVGQFFKYRKTNPKRLYTNILWSFVAGGIITIGQGLLYGLSNPLLLALLFASGFAITGNILYAVKELKLKVKNMGGSIAHVGFGVLLIGVLVSSAKKEVISENRTVSFGADVSAQETRENILLWENEPYKMREYLVTYLGDSISGPNHIYKVKYTKIDKSDSFILYPNAQIGDNGQLFPNPSTKHYLTRDIFTHVTSVPMEDTEEEKDWGEPIKKALNPGDTIQGKNGVIRFERIDRSIEKPENLKHDLLAAVLSVTDAKGKKYEAKPIFAVGQNDYFTISDEIEALKMKLNFDIDVKTETPQAIISVWELPIEPKHIIMKAYLFPYINLVWAGTIIMIIGFTLSIVQRAQQLKLQKG